MLYWEKGSENLNELITYCLFRFPWGEEIKDQEMMTFLSFGAQQSVAFLVCCWYHRFSRRLYLTLDRSIGGLLLFHLGLQCSHAKAYGRWRSGEIVIFSFCLRCTNAFTEVEDSPPSPHTFELSPEEDIWMLSLIFTFCFAKLNVWYVVLGM